MEGAQQAPTVPVTSPSVPEWVRGKVLPRTGTPAESVQVLRNKAHKSAVVFARGRTYVAEKPLMRRPRLYEVYFPEDYIVVATECPHCHETIDAQFLRAGVEQRTGDGAEEAPRRVPTGKNYPIVEVEGIGETFAKRLEKIDVRTTDDLLAAEPQRIAEAARVSPTVVEKWYAMAELMRVKGVGKQFAELLVRSGITSVDVLAEQDPAFLLKRLIATQSKTGVRIQGARLNEKRVGQWIEEAKSAERLTGAESPRTA